MKNIKTDGEALRYNEGKPRYDLIPPEFMDALAKHFAYGANKYADRNWERGMSWGKCFASLMRHAWAWMGGEDVDEESGSHHMTAVAWNAMALMVYGRRRIGEDDRVTTVVDDNAPTSGSTRGSFTYWYLATPYTKYPEGRDAAFEMSARITALLIRAGLPVYCPIAHTHPVARLGGIDETDHDTWVAVDKPLLDGCGGVIVYCDTSWEISRGVAHEIDQAKAAGKPVFYWRPSAGTPVSELRELMGGA